MYAYVYLYIIYIYSYIENMSLTYCSVIYEGDTDKLIECLKDKVEAHDVKRISKEKVNISIPLGNLDDLVFLKSYLEEEEKIFIKDVKF